MSEVFDGAELYPPDDPRNPFFGLDGFDARTIQPPDPYERLEKDVLDSLGIASFDEILIKASERDIESARGNRFETIKEAIVYLFDAGILRFSGVVIDDDEIEIDVDKNS